MILSPHNVNDALVKRAWICSPEKALTCAYLFHVLLYSRGKRATSFTQERIFSPCLCVLWHMYYYL
jgi:hypothetical protein